MTTITAAPAAARTADDIARRLATPPTGDEFQRQGLAHGAVGIALLHLERARQGLGDWATAHAWTSYAAARDTNTADHASLYQDAPALAFLLHAAADPAERYQDARRELDHHVRALTNRRIEAARARIRARALGNFHEYDVLYGLTGLGNLLLRTQPGTDELGDVLTYLVGLTRPVPVDGTNLPGWWVGHEPDRTSSTRGGHANLGAAHGIPGPLTLLSHALLQGVEVPGHAEAIRTVLAWLDSWKQTSTAGAWWPETVRRTDQPGGPLSQIRPGRPSWCYGTPGLARASQLAARALGNQTAQRDFEQALADCLADQEQLDEISDAGLCHGWAGLFQTAWRVAQDALDPSLFTPHLPALAATLTFIPSPAQFGFLTGQTGQALTLMTAASDAAPTTEWDQCLLTL